MRYRTIVADPPWPVEWHGGGQVRKTRKGLGYEAMSVEAIRALPVPELADDDAALFLWVTAALNREGVGARVARAWDFTVVGEFVWHKGMTISGHFPRGCHEVVLVARRGGFRFPLSWVDSVQVWRGSTRHSAKPEGFLDLVEQYCPSPRVELFARRHRLGWDVWGDESANTATLVSDKRA